MSPGPLFLGLDLGTSGMRGIAATASGHVFASARVDFPADNHDTRRWWDALTTVTQNLVHQIGSNVSRLRALSVVSTSGTLICADDDGNATAPALMYHDSRATQEAGELQAADHGTPYQFSPSFSLPKAMWMQRHEPALFSRSTRLCHPADWIASQLSGAFVSDYSNALKMGYDLTSNAWPEWMDPSIVERLPPVVAPGTVTGWITPKAHRKTHLPAGLPIVAGVTDGVAGALASGIRRLGDCNTALGTTLIFKALSSTAVHGPNLYSHKLPGGLWLPGAASNTGAAWIKAWFKDHDPAALDQHSVSLLPTPHISYPLTGRGERFPFANSETEGFVAPAATLQERYASCLQGTAFVERLAYDMLEHTAGIECRDIYATGGGSRSNVWMQCRADVTHRVIHRPACPETAMGAAILAATGTEFDHLAGAMGAMTQIERTFTPAPHTAYDEAYGRFLECLPIKRRLNDV